MVQKVSGTPIVHEDAFNRALGVIGDAVKMLVATRKFK